MSWMIFKIVNDLPVPVDMRALPEAEAMTALAAMRTAEPAEQFVALGVLS